MGEGSSASSRILIARAAARLPPADEPPDRDVVGRHAEVDGVAGYPCVGRVRVVDRRREWILGRVPVFDRDDDNLCFDASLSTDRLAYEVVNPSSMPTSLRTGEQREEPEDEGFAP